MPGSQIPFYVTMPPVGDNSNRPAPTTWVAAYVNSVASTLKRTTVSDQNYTILSTDKYVAITSISAARTVTLPASTGYPAGAMLIIADESGNCSSTNTITISCNSSDTINSQSSYTINYARGFLKLESNESNGWIIVGQSIASTFSSTLPQMDGTATTGSSNSPARIDHVHASDTSRAKSGTNTDITSLGYLNSVNGGPLAGFRNRIINGAMDVQQRGGGNFSITANSMLLTADRWYVGSNGAAAVAYTGTTTALASSGLSNYLGVNGASGNTALTVFTRLESANVYDLSGKTVTISAWVYNSTAMAANTINLYLQAPGSNGGKDNWSGNTTTLNSTTFSQALPAATWTYVTATISSLGSTVNGLQVYFNFGPVTTGNIYITGGQLEVGSVATPYERRPFALEMFLCQRYYETSYQYGILPGYANGSNGYYIGASWVYFSTSSNYQASSGTLISYKVPKCITPTVTFYSVFGASGKVRDAQTSNDVTPSVPFASGLTGIQWYAQTSNSQPGLNMYAHWVAVAEL